MILRNHIFSILFSVVLIAGCGQSSKPQSQVTHQGQDTLEDCDLPEAADVRKDDVLCLYFTGTRFFRNEDYRQAAAHWQRVIAPDATSEFPPEQISALKLDALSNLGYLTYHGLGISQNQNQAIKYLISAACKGQTESRSHLGYAYSDPNKDDVDWLQAFAWYRSVELMFEQSEPESDTEWQVQSIALSASAEMKAKLSPKQVPEAEELAKRYANLSEKDEICSDGEV